MQNIVQLRESLANNYTAMKGGDMKLDLGKELANTAGKIISSCALELEYNRRMGINKTIAYLEKDSVK